MPASTPVRAAIAIAALLALIAGYRWWNSPERHIHRLLADVSSTLSHDGSETDLLSLAAVASLQNYMTSDIAIDLGNASTMKGRQEVMSLAARFRAVSPMVRVQFFDPDIRFSDDSTGTTLVTAQVTTQDRGGQEVAAAYVVRLSLVRSEGRWLVAGARLLPPDTPL